ncbi:B3 domain-containing protein At1g05920-like [Pyrus communis]|uniref:B3 domain-containing protein At1g05920-like n=1 Tax=Pyrus communis TaxID=23211 RepID=UPI0035BEC086
MEFTEEDFDASQNRMIALLEVARLATEDLVQEELMKQKRKIKKPMLIDWAAKKNRSSNISFKRNWEMVDDPGDVDCTPVELKMQKMSLKNNTKKGADTMNIALKKKETISPSAPLGYHNLPEEFKREIERLGGTKVELVIEKQFTKTDLSSGNRMSMPLNQIVSISFLEDEDMEMLENGETMTVRLIDPGLVQGDINLRRLEMGKNLIYALRTQWGDVARKNKLKAADLVQVWSFRVNRALHLALVLAKSSSVEGDHQESDGGGDSECQSSIVDGGSSNSGGSEAEQRSWKNGTGGDNYGIIKGF